MNDSCHHHHCPFLVDATKSAIDTLIEICKGDFDSLTADHRIKAAHTLLIMLDDIRCCCKQCEDGCQRV